MDQQNNNQCKNNNTLFNTAVSNVFVVKNAKRRAFIEQFNYTSINFTQKDLGTILGFFIVRDHSTTSENIVNFLASEIKKHYFSPIQKPIEEKFESTLHHINRALEELANIGNVDWLGSIEGVVCAIDETSIHFSVTGNATILLFRNNTLINIGEGLASPEAADYPLKTFVDISSGDMCAHDKIIITSQELLDLISLDELQKNATRMGQKNFIQFIETVLTNECVIASAIVIDVTEKEALVPASITETPPTQESAPQNFFSANAFEKKIPDIIDLGPAVTVEELIQNEPLEYTDPRTGHIHIQGTDDIPQKSSPFEGVSEFFADMRDALSSQTKKHARAITKKISSFRESDEIDSESLSPSTDLTSDQVSNFQKSQHQEKSIKGFLFMERCAALMRSMWLRCITFAQHLYKKITDLFYALLHRGPSSSAPEYTSSSDDHAILSYVQSAPLKKRILPHVSRLLYLWRSMHTKTKFMTIGVLMLIICVPLIMKALPLNSPAPEESPTVEPLPQDVPLTDSKLSTEQSPTPQITASTLLTSDRIQSVITLNSTVLGIEQTAISLISDTNSTRIALPADAGSIVFATPMQDLNMLFVITDTDRMYSFSPASPRFIQQEKIPTLDHTKITNIGTFMTYLYIADTTMIKRHVRIENGFDDGKEWLKQNNNFTNLSSMTIGESIYIAQNGALLRFTQGNNDEITVDQGVQHTDIIYTTPHTNFLWIVDKNAQTLYKVDHEDLKIRETFTHENFAQATSLTVDESSKKAYISTEKEISSYNL